ncbi:MAG: hypothetical protein WDZ56_01525 [Candidatus Paceibacterota bacterium]
MTDSWDGIGSALERANREWDVHLMPATVAEMIELISISYSKSPSQPFEDLLEEVVEDVRFDIDKYSDEWRAAKQAVGTVFAKRRQERHKHNFTKIGD